MQQANRKVLRKGVNEIKMNSWVNRIFGKSNPSPQRKQAKKPTPKTQQNPYRGVTIYSRGDCCEAAQRVQGQKFLAAHAPQLPLGGCTQPELCKCRYKHLADRRAEVRRDADHGLPGQRYHIERRTRKGDRRKAVH